MKNRNDGIHLWEAAHKIWQKIRVDRLSAYKHMLSKEVTQSNIFGWYVRTNETCSEYTGSIVYDGC